MDETNFTRMNPGKQAPAILMPLPDRDFDPTESAIPWQSCTARGWQVTFSTAEGRVAQADPNLLKGLILGPLGASPKAVAAYRRMTQHPAFQHPIPYAEIDPAAYQGLLLPGGHASGMLQYWESPVLQAKVLQFFQLGKVIGAICHGMMVLARTVDPQTERSVLYGHKVTVLPESMDRTGHMINKTLLKRSYTTYPLTIVKEVLPCLAHPEDFIRGPGSLTPFAVCDGSLVTARYWLDAGLFAQRFIETLEQRLGAEM